MSETLDATQNAILDAVIACIEKYGFAATTTRRIASEAGVNEVTLFRRFGNKEEILRQLYQRERGQIRLELRYTGDLEADLTRVVEGYSAIIARRGNLIVLMFSELPRSPELRDVFDQPLQLFGAVVGLLARYQAEGRLRPEPPDHAAGALIGPLLMAGLTQGFAPLPTMPDPRTHVRNFLAGRGVG